MLCDNLLGNMKPQFIPTILFAQSLSVEHDIRSHKLDIYVPRHTFGSRMARSGAGLVHVQHLMGHSDPKLTAQVYTHLDVEDLRGAIEIGILR